MNYFIMQRIIICYSLLHIFQVIAHEGENGNCIIDSSGNTTCAARIFMPRTLEELQATVRTAITDGKKIRPFGGLHSVIAGFPGEGEPGGGDVEVGEDNYLISMRGLDKILEIDLHKMTVKAQGGVSLYNLSRELAKHGLELIDQPGAYEITVGGMLANAVHGSGRHGSYADAALEIQFVDGRGNLQIVSSSSHPEWLPAARVSLGVLGVIYAATLQCFPATKRDVVAEVVPLATVVPKIDRLLATQEHFQLLLDPVSESTLVQTFNVTNAPVTNNSTRNFARYLANSAAVGEVNAIVNPLLPVSAYAAINEAIIAGGIASGVVEFFYKSVSFFHESAVSRARINELSVRAEFVRQALADFVKLVQDYKARGIEFIATSEVRFVSDANFSYLSPTNRPSWLIGFIIIFPDKSEQATNILRDFNDILLKYEGRPSWGNNPEFLTVEKTIRLYGKQNVDAFNAVRRIFRSKWYLLYSVF